MNILIFYTWASPFLTQAPEFNIPASLAGKKNNWDSDVSKLIFARVRRIPNISL